MDSKKQTTIRVDNSTIIRALILIFFAVLGFMLLRKMADSLMLVVISAFLAIGLNPAVSWIARKLRLKSRVTATGIAYVLVVGFLISFFALVFPPIVKQTIDFVKQAPQTVNQLRHDNKKIDELIIKYNVEEEVSKYTKNFGSNIQKYSSNALATAGKVGATFAKTLIVFVMTFMMLVEGPVWMEKYFKSLLKSRRERQKQLAAKMYKVIVGYFNGQVMIALAGGFFATIALLITSNIMHVDINEIALGGIVALFALMPMIGTTIGASIVCLSVAVSSLPMAIVMAIFFFVYQHIENVTLQPFIQSRSSSISPLVVFVAAILGVSLGGLVGALFAIPAAGCIKVYADDYFARRAKYIESR